MFGAKKKEKELELTDVLFLPSDGNGLNLNLKKNGEWTGYGSDQLRNIADHLPDIRNDFNTQSHEAQSKNAGIDEFSIPSPWAKFILFETALFNEGLDSLHKNIISEWRGLMAFLALRELRGFNVSFDEISLADKRGTFYDILMKTRPSNYIFEADALWDRLYLIRMDQVHVIGMLSNSTFVCAPYEYGIKARINLEKRVSWFKNGKFADPVPYIDSEYAEALVIWLQELSGQIRNYAQGGNLNKIIGLFNDFISDIKARFDSGLFRQVGALQCTNASTPALNVCQLMKISVRRRDDDGASDVALYANSNFIIVSKRMWNIEVNHNAAEKIRIFGNVSLREYPEDFVSGSKMFGLWRIPDDTVIYKAEDLFLKEIYMIKLESDEAAVDDTDSPGNRNAFSGYTGTVHFRGSRYSVIWPVSKVLLEHISPWEIKDNIKVKAINDSQIEVSLKIKLAGPAFLKRPGQDYIDFEVFKTYDIKEPDKKDSVCSDTGRIRLNELASHNLPNIAVWPYQLYSYKVDTESNAGVWSKYYTFISTDYDSKLTVKPAYGSQDINEYKLGKIPDKYIDCRMIHSKCLPKYIECKYNNSLGDSDIGILFLKKPEKIFIDVSKQWKIGMDFGTTSTAAFYDDGRKKDFIRLGRAFDRSADGAVHIDEGISDNAYLITNPNDSTFNDPVYKYFIPYAYLNKRIYLSMYEKLRDVDPGEFNDFLKAFFDGHIFFHNNKVRFDASAENIYKNLKWGDENQTKVARQYLKQILLQCLQKAASNGVGSIDFRFSYPSALGENRKNIYVQSLNAAIKSLQEETGLDIKISCFSTESLASSLFFQNIDGMAKPLPNEAFACIDIGGASTDISVWKRDEENSSKLQSSFRFASRSIFLMTLCKSPEVFNKLILDPIRNDSNAYGLIYKNKSIPEDFMSQIEYELFENETRIENDRTNIMGTDSYVDFIKLVSLGFLGMLYYISMLLSNLFKKGDLQDIKRIKLFLSGNGAKLYKWVLTCTSDKVMEEKIAQLLKPYGVDEIKIYFNESALKTEAAMGLLYVDNSNNDLSRERMISGEKFSIKTKDGANLEYDWDTDLLDKNEGLLDRFIAKEIDIKPDVDLENLRKFIGMVNEIFEEKGRRAQIDFNASMQNSLVGLIQRKLLDLKSDERLDPLFILGIHSLLELMYSENEKKLNP